MLGVSVDTVRRWCDEGLLRTTRTSGGHRLIDGRSLARFLAAQHEGSASEEPVVARSARNRFPGVVTKVTRDKASAVVEIQAGPHRLVSLMTREAADELDLKAGDRAVGSVKATSVVIEVPAR